MGYSLQSRLHHASKRMSEINTVCMTYIDLDGNEILVDASPILISADELSGGNASLVRVERQDFVVWRCQHGPAGERGLGSLYPPLPGCKLRKQDGEEFTLASMGNDEPPYTHTTSNRDRVILHTVRTDLPNE